MLRELQKRLRKLESSRPRRRPELTEKEKAAKYAKYLLWFAIAEYLGDPNPGEAPVADKAENGEGFEALKRMDVCLSEDYRNRLMNIWRDRSYD